MKIAHISDIHGDLETLVSFKDWNKETKPDVVVCSGDLSGPCLTEEEAKKMYAAFSMMREIGMRESIPFKELLGYLESKKFEPAMDYLALVQKFDKKAREHYNELLGIFAEFPQFPDNILTVPGNWDSERQYPEYFNRSDIHKKVREIDGVEFLGYGGAEGVPMFLPPTRIVSYSDESEEELFGLLIRKKPEILVTHTPPKRVLDETFDKKHVGSWASLAYIRNPYDTSELLLCGHVHEARGVQRPEELGTLVINPGNLGKYGDFPGKGYFVEIDYNGPTESIKVKRYKIRDNGKVDEIKGE